MLDEGGRVYELMRFMTPYRVGASWVLDISDFLPLLSGSKEFEVFIDTWVGPGHPQGEGWLVTAKLTFMNKEKSKRAFKVIPIFDPNVVEYGNPEWEAELNAAIGHLPEHKSARLISYVTGHGQGNTENCAEFCPQNHRFQVGQQSQVLAIWRDNCDKTITKGSQMGTWQFARAGWCPGDKVDPIIFDVDSLESTPIEISWKPEDYVNENHSDYDGQAHTKPVYRVSSYLILYR